jgi:hypothetical protein
MVAVWETDSHDATRAEIVPDTSKLSAPGAANRWRATGQLPSAPALDHPPDRVKKFRIARQVGTEA